MGRGLTRESGECVLEISPGLGGPALPTKSPRQIQVIPEHPTTLRSSVWRYRDSQRATACPHTPGPFSRATAVSTFQRRFQLPQVRAAESKNHIPESRY